MDDKERKHLAMLMAEKLPVLRKETGLSQQALAALAGISRSTITKIEGKSQTMTWNTYLSLLFIFSKNEQTKDLIKFFGIYPDEVDEYLSEKLEKEVDYEK